MNNACSGATSGVQSELRHAQYVWVVPCMALSYGGLWLRSLRWRVLLGYRIAPARSFHILNVSYFVNGVLPLRVGELVRAVLAARIDPPLPVFTSLSTIVVERLLDTLAVFALVGLVLALLPVGLEIGFLGMALGVGAVIGVIVLAVLAARPAWAHALLDWLARIIPPLRRPALRAWLDNALEGIRPLASVRATLLAVWWTAAAWTLSVVAGYALLFAIFGAPTWVAAMAMVALASFVIAVPVPGSRPVRGGDCSPWPARLRSPADRASSRLRPAAARGQSADVHLRRLVAVGGRRQPGRSDGGGAGLRLAGRGAAEDGDCTGT